MILMELEKQEIDRRSLISNVFHWLNSDSFDHVARIRQTPSGESASRDIADGVCEIRSQNDSCIWIDQSKDAASPTRCIRAYPPLSHRLKEFRDGAS